MDPRVAARRLVEQGLLAQTSRACRVYHVPSAVFLERDGVWLVIAPDKPHWVSTNARGAAILRLVDGRRTVADVAAELSRTLGGRDAPLEEVAAFLERLQDEELVSLRPDLSPPYRGRAEAVAPGRLAELYVFVTNDCNLRCTHCYVSSGDDVPANELTTAELTKLVDDARELGVSRFYFTGGEPFMRRDIFELVEHVCRDSELVILTNAMYFGPKNAERLEAVAARANRDVRRLYFQVSLDGPTAEIHELVRGPDNFDKTIDGIETLVRLGLTPAVSTCVNVHNRDHLADTTRLLGSLGVKEQHILWLQERGRANDHDELLVAPSTVTKIMRELRPVAEAQGMVIDNETSHRVRVRAKRGRKTDLCNCGYESLDVFSDGHVYPCVWFSGAPSLSCGSIREKSLEEIWLGSEILQGIRDNSVQKREGCSDCHLKFLCGGGTSCSSYFDSLATRGRGSFQAADPYCETFMDMTYDLLWELASENVGKSPSASDTAQLFHAMEGEGALCSRPHTRELDSAFEVGSFHCSCVLQEDVEEGRKVHTAAARAAAARAGDLPVAPERKKSLPIAREAVAAPSAPAAPSPAFDEVFDGMGQACVDLLLPMARQVKALAPGAVLRVVTDDPAAREDLGAWCRMTGNELVSVERKEGYATFFVRRGSGPAA